MTPNDACTHARARHKHGTDACYLLDACRCTPCTDAHREYAAARRRRIAYGQPAPYVDAAPVQAHITRLREAGMSQQDIANAMGWQSKGRLYYVMRNPRLRRETAAGLLAIEPGVSLADLEAGRQVDATGTRRRLEALACLGWSLRSLADALGVNRELLEQACRRRYVTAETARLVGWMYDRMSMTPRTGPVRAVAMTRNRAARLGFVPPLAWDDIDDPAETPNVGVKGRGLDLDEWLHLVLGGESPEQAARRCRSQVSDVQRAAREQGRPDVLRAIAEYTLRTSAHGTAITHAEALLAEIKDAA